MTEVEQAELETLVENWRTIAPTIAELQRRCGLSRVEAMLLWQISQKDNDLDEPEPWKA